MTVLALLAPPAIIGLIGIAGFISPGYSPVSQTMSRLAEPGMPHVNLFRGALVAQAIGMSALAYLLWRVLGSRWRFGVPAFLLVVYALASLADAAFQAESSKVILWGVTANQIHQHSAHVGVAAMVAAMAVATWALWNQPGWQQVARVSGMMVGIVLVVGVTFPFQLWPDVHGALERFMLGTTLVWVDVMAVALWRYAGNVSDPLQDFVRRVEATPASSTGGLQGADHR